MSGGADPLVGSLETPGWLCEFRVLTLFGFSEDRLLKTMSLHPLVCLGIFKMLSSERNSSDLISST